MKLASPKRFRNEGLELRREIPSTPNKSPFKDSRLQGNSPLIKEEEEDDRDQASFNLLSTDIAKTERQENLMNKDKELKQTILLLSSPYEDGVDAHMPIKSLLDPDRNRSQTQAIFREPTPIIDFDVPEPDEGWGHPEPGGKQQDFRTDYETISTKTDDTQANSVDTQAILRGTTQVPDLDLPLPEGGWDSLPPSSSQEASKNYRTLESEASSSADRDQFDAWITSYVQEGFSKEFVQEVVGRTSIDTNLAGKLLDSLQKGKGKSQGGKKHEIPHDWRGVWTAAEDEDLFSTDARKINKLEAKHGTELLQSRWEYLEFLKQLN